MGIIINEILTNTFKYAFTDRMCGTVSILVTKDEDRVSIVVQDNGIGMTESRSREESSGLGLYLVQMLVEQLKGTYTVTSDSGLRTIITFPSHFRCR